MIFTVTATRDAEDQLTTIWVQAPDKQDVTDAANWIERHLRTDAHQKGINFGDYRSIVYPPLVANFTVDQGDCKVSIFEIRRTT